MKSLGLQTSSRKSADATNSLERGLLLLQLIGGKRGGLTNGQISRELRIPKSTCSYILQRLERQGYVMRHAATGRYKIGLEMLALARYALREVGLRALAEPALYKLTHETGLVASLGVLDGDHVLIIDRVESPDFVKDTVKMGQSTWPYYPPREQRDIGTELSLYASSSGRVLLASLPRQALIDLLKKIRVVKMTPHTVVSRTQLMAELKLVREQGYALVDQQSHLDTRALAVPIVDFHGATRAALSIGGTRVLNIWKEHGRLVRVITDAGREISKRLP